MNKQFGLFTLKFLQILFSISGMVICGCISIFFFYILNEKLDSVYIFEVISYFITLSIFPIMTLIFFVSIVEIKAFYCLLAIPVLFILANVFEKSSYCIDLILTNVKDHRLIGKSIILKNKKILVSGLPKKRFRSRSYLCKHDYEIIYDYKNRSPFFSEIYFNREFRGYREPTYEDINPPMSFQVIGAFICERILYLSLKDPKGRLIEVQERDVQYSIDLGYYIN